MVGIIISQTEESFAASAVTGTSKLLLSEVFTPLFVKSSRNKLLISEVLLLERYFLLLYSQDNYIFKFLFIFKLLFMRG